MPVIALILSTALFWVVYWFIRMGGIDHFQQRKAQRKEEARKREAKELARTSTLRSVDDPRDAAAILMLLVARVHGDPTREQIATVEHFLRNEFGFEAELTERMTQARFVARQADDFEQAAKVFAKLFTTRLTASECTRLIEMLEAVAREGGSSEHQIEAIATFRPMIGLAAAA
jgi:uncharacterized tellurite resistance protein B-like protein